MKKSDLFEHIFAHLDVAELCGMGEFEFFPEPVQYGGVEVGPLVQQVEQFRGCGRVLIVGFEATGILYVTAKGRVRKSLACWWGRRARMLTRIMETILSCVRTVENTTLRANAYLEGVSTLAPHERPKDRPNRKASTVAVGQDQEQPTPLTITAST